MKENNNGWQIKSLGEVAEIVTGGTPSTIIKEYWEGGDIPWLNSGELNQGIITSSSNYITQLGLKNSGAKLMPPYTVLIALTGATTGKVGYLTFEACANQSVTGILPSVNHDSKFVYYYLQTLREKILSVAWGGAQKHIHQQFVKNLKIPLPPLPIQKQIAEILEKADQAKQKRKEANKLTDEFLQSVFIEMFGDPVKNPKGWVKGKAGHLFEMKLGKMRSEKNITGEYLKPYLRNINVQWGRIDLTDIKKMDFDPREQNIYSLKKGDILVCEGGEVGRTAIWNGEINDIYFQNALHRLRVKAENIDSIYFLYFMFFAAKYGLIIRQTSTVTIAHFTAEKLKGFDVMLPPLSLQQQFAEIVNKTESLKEKQKQSEQELENLFQSLMQSAFKGELVS